MEKYSVKLMKIRKNFKFCSRKDLSILELLNNGYWNNEFFLPEYKCRKFLGRNDKIFLRVLIKENTFKI